MKVEGQIIGGEGRLTQAAVIRAQVSKATWGETNQVQGGELNGTDSEKCLHLSHSDELQVEGLLLSLSLTPLLAGFINRPLCFLSNPQRAQDSLKEKSGTRSHLGGEGWYTLCNGHESRCSSSGSLDVYALLQVFPFCFVFFLTQNDVTADFTIVSVTAAYRTPRCESTWEKHNSSCMLA